jgi:hypothetical protein
VSLRKETLKNTKEDFRSQVLKIEKRIRVKRREVKEELLENKSNKAAVHLHLRAQHTWPQLYACLSITCSFCISSHPPVSPVRFRNNRSEKKLTPVLKSNTS